MPRSVAILRASGEAKTRSEPLLEPLLVPLLEGAAVVVAVAVAVLDEDSLEPSALALGAFDALPADEAASARSSPSSAITTIRSPTLTFEPSLAASLAMRPSSKASSSIVALSVSMSASTSPGATVSPSLTCHLTTVPCSIVSDIRGMVTEIDIAALPYLSVNQARTFLTAAAIRSGFGRYAYSSPLA